jgi:drug/metabolite transporter (DMT)-like permease
MTLTDNTKAWLAFASVAFFWGTTYLAIRIGVASFPPLLFAGIRHFTAGVLILSYFIIRKYPLPSKKDFGQITVMAMLMVFLGNGLFVWAEKYVSSSIAALISTASPFVVFLLSWAAGNEKPNWRVITGIIIGFAGQLSIFYDKIDLMEEQNYRWGIFAMFIAAVCWSFGSVYRRKTNTTMNALYFTGWQMLIGGFTFIPFALIMGEHTQMQTITPNAIWALLYLIVFGSIIAYGSFMYVLGKLPTTTVSMHSHINTIVAVFLGWLVLNETLNWVIALSTLLTLSGVYLVNQGLKRNKK